MGTNMQDIQFLSTLSLRRATGRFFIYMLLFQYFYPRSPCGERRRGAANCYLDNIISIHALLAESDNLRVVDGSKSSIISIHALLAESDGKFIVYQWCNCNFYPRSPCGERLSIHTAPARSHKISIHALLAESDYPKGFRWQNQRQFLSTLSLRRATKFVNLRVVDGSFLSTLSLRRATDFGASRPKNSRISIHALLAESDSKSAQNSGALLRI